MQWRLLLIDVTRFNFKRLTNIENHTVGTGTRQPTQVQSLRWHQTKPNCWTSLRLTKPWAKALLYFLHCCPAWHVPSENRQATEICMKFCPRHATCFCYNSFREMSSSSGSSSPSSCGAWVISFWLGRIGPLFQAAGTDIINRPHWFNWSRLQFYMSQICWSNKIKSYPAWLLQNCPISASPEITRNKGTATPLRSKSRAAHQHVMMNNDEQPFSNASPILPAANCHTWETNLAYQYNTVYSILCLRPGVVQNQRMLDLDITRERYACEKHPKPPKRSFMKLSSFSACPLLFAGA